MKPIELNLASRPFRNDLPLGVLLALLAISALGLTAHNTYTWITADSRLAALDREMADHEQRMAEIQSEADRLQKELEAIDLDVLAPQAEFANAVLRERNFSWTRFFNALEQVLPWHTKLSSIRPRFDAGRVIIDLTATSQNYDSFLDFQTALQNSPFFDQVVPTGYETGKGSDNRIFFSLEFAYDPDVELAAPSREDDGRQAGVETIVVPEEGAGDAAVDRGLTANGGAGSGREVLAVDVPETVEPAALAAEESGSADPRREKAGKSRAGRAGKARGSRSQRKAGRQRRNAADPSGSGGQGDFAGSAVLPPGGSGGARRIVEPALAERPKAGASKPKRASENQGAQGPDGKDAKRRRLTPEELKAEREAEVVYENGVPMITPKIKSGPLPKLPKEIRDRLPDGHPAKGDSGDNGNADSGSSSEGGTSGSSGSGGSGSGSSGGGQP
ncbi:MAG: hypothetical protein Q9Q40_13260 [Acidobacteriota bacterium]|nr:hypothetical protein [Acidobacteriota bacterium]